MNRNYNVYPKNKIGNGIGILNFPLRPINSFSAGKKNLGNEHKSAFQKSKKIKKLIEEIKSSNKSNSNKGINDLNNYYRYQQLLIEEKEKNKNLMENIIQLNNHIDALESQLSCRCEHHIINDEIMMLRKENEELRIFKQKVYEYSMKYDEINKDVLLCLKNIEKAVELFNINYPNSNSMEYKNDTLNKMSDNYNSIITNLTNFLKTKEDEYNTLLFEKENEINKLKVQLGDMNMNNINKFSEDMKNKINEYEYDNYNGNIDSGNNYQINEIYNQPYMTSNLNIENDKEQIIFKNTLQK